MGKWGAREGLRAQEWVPAQVSGVSALVLPAALFRDARCQTSEWGQAWQLEALLGHLQLAGHRALSSFSGPLF